MKRPSIRDVIADTMLEILETKSIESVTVSSIIKETEISSRTFYNHFRDKFDVCNYIYDRILDQHCWNQDGKRSTLNCFFENLTKAIRGDYYHFFMNTTFYNGQNSLEEHIIERGIQDLSDQLRYTGHENLVTPQNRLKIDFFMRGCASLLHSSLLYKQSKLEIDTTVAQTEFLPNSLYEALTAEPIYAPEMFTISRKNKRQQ